MTGSRMTNWNPEQELAALLDSLTEELHRAFDHEISGYRGEPADQRQDNADAVRRIVAAAEAASGVLPVSPYIAPGLPHRAMRNLPN